MLTDPALIEPIPRRASTSTSTRRSTSSGSVQGIDMRFAGHTHFVTVGLADRPARLPGPDLRASTGSRRRSRSCSSTGRSPAPIAHDALTTVGNWRGYGSIEHEGVLLRPEGPLAAAADRPAAADPRARSCWRSRSTRRDARTWRRWPRNGWELLDPARGGGHARALPALRPGLQGRARRRQERLRRRRAAAGSATAASATSPRAGRSSRRTPGSAAACRPARGCSPSTTPTTSLAAHRRRSTPTTPPRRAARAIAEEHFDSDRVLTRLLDGWGARR